MLDWIRYPRLWPAQITIEQRMPSKKPPPELPSSDRDPEGAPAGAGDEPSPDPSKPVPGRRLIDAVLRKLDELNLPEAHVPVKVLSISRVYWTALTNGNRPIGGLPKDKMMELAKFLE